MSDPKFEQLVQNRNEWVEVNKKNKFRIEELLSGLYDDPSHFVYEILQNAEDVQAEIVKFTLEENQLEIWHNGTDFKFENVEAITGIGISTKKTDLNAIGKFGVGFKSVFAITTTPTICSGPYAFEIKNFVVPNEIKETDGDGTHIGLPLNNPKRSQVEIYELIKSRLNELGLETLMFLANINRIECDTDGHSEIYYRKIVEKDRVRYIYLTHERDGEVIAEEKWIVLEKGLCGNRYISEEIEQLVSERGKPLTEEERKKLKVEIAFALDGSNEDEHLVRLEPERSRLSAFFLTKIRTGLHFIIQGPYRTTPARDNVPFDDNWNKQLMIETAELVAESISIVKEMGLLDVGFLNTMPLVEEQLEKGVSEIYETVKNKLASDDPLLPVSLDGYASRKNVLIARGKELTTLLDGEQIEELFGRNSWLTNEITVDRYGELWEYLTKKLEIPEIRPENFIMGITRQFIEKQDDDWLIRFYDYAAGREKFWEKDAFGYNWQIHDSLRIRPIIRMEDGTHMMPFTKKGEELVYLPSGEADVDDEFDIVKISIANDPRAMSFFEKLKLKKPDTIARVHEKILPKYRPDNIFDRFDDENSDIQCVPIEENIYDIKAILVALKKGEKDERLKGVAEQIWGSDEGCEFILAANMKTNERRYVSPCDYVFLGSKYTGETEIELFYDRDEEAWFVDDCYIGRITKEELKTLDCSDKIYINCKNPSDDGHVYLSGYRHYARGRNGFDPECEIFGLEKALNTITYEKSLIIWDLLKRHYEKIYGTVEQSSRQDFSNSGKHYLKESTYSIMGRLLTEKEWLYKDCSLPPVQPSEITLEELSNDYDKESTGKFISGQLHFKTPIQEELKEKMTEDEWELHEVLLHASRLGIKDEVIDFIRKRIESEQMKNVEKTPSQIARDLEEALTATNEELCPEEADETQVMPSLTPEEEEEIEKVHGKEIPKILKKIKLKTNVKATTDSTCIGTIDVAQFLMSEYDGHCQICNTRLFSGRKSNKRGGLEFMATRIIETGNTRPYSNMEWNVLCLCPNHFALFKYGVKDPKGIWNLAKEVIAGEKTPEFVEERGKTDYYIAKIYMMSEKGRVEETEIFYTPNHFRKITALIKQGDEEENSP